LFDLSAKGAEKQFAYSIIDEFLYGRLIPQ